MDETVQSEQSLVQEELDDWKDFRDELRPKISNCHIELRKTKNKPVPFERVELLVYAKEVEVYLNGMINKMTMMEMMNVMMMTMMTMVIGFF